MGEVFSEKSFQLFGRKGTAGKEPLDPVALVFFQVVPLLLAFHPFGRGGEVQALS